MSHTVLPNFLVIGPGKSGTTWIYQILKEHPEICVSSAKETLFFEKYYSNGVDWYAKFFKHCTQAKTKAIGEVSNTYIFSSKAPQRIYEFNPQMKLLSSCRNPIDRAFSHYLFLKRNGTYNKSFDKAIQEERHIIERGRYHNYFQRYLEFFPKEQLKILIYDDLKRDPIEFASSIFSYLETTEYRDLPSLREKVLVASKARNKYLSLITKKSAELVRDLGYPELIETVKRSFIPNLLYKPLDRTKDKEEISQSAKAYLKEFYKEDIERLSELLDRDLLTLWVPS